MHFRKNKKKSQLNHVDFVKIVYEKYVKIVLWCAAVYNAAYVRHSRESSHNLPQIGFRQFMN